MNHRSKKCQITCSTGCGGSTFFTSVFTLILGSDIGDDWLPIPILLGNFGIVVEVGVFAIIVGLLPIWAIRRASRGSIDDAPTVGIRTG
jgi:hypothetical protein